MIIAKLVTQKPNLQVRNNFNEDTVEDIEEEEKK